MDFQIHHFGLDQVLIHRATKNLGPYIRDNLIIEAPLQIQIKQKGQIYDLMVTMRTPGDDFNLIYGLLYAEGLIEKIDHINSFQYINPSLVRITLKEDPPVDLQSKKRNFISHSSCGLCGVNTIESLSHLLPNQHPEKTPLVISTQLIYSLPGKLRPHQYLFQKSGSSHATGIFSLKGQLEWIGEDVGRHNATDKAIGNAIASSQIPLMNKIIFFSGRVSFELMQKTVKGKIPIVVAIGAPSTLAIKMAQKYNVTLIGLLKKERFNLYHWPNNVTINE